VTLPQGSDFNLLLFQVVRNNNFRSDRESENRFSGLKTFFQIRNYLEELITAWEISDMLGCSPNFLFRNEEVMDEGDFAAGCFHIGCNVRRVL
jgi:hypothetical protein